LDIQLVHIPIAHIVVNFLVVGTAVGVAWAVALGVDTAVAA
jgi:hypothetical protein